MLTRLFSNISVQAGIIALISLLILNATSIYFIDFQGLSLKIGQNTIVFGTNLIKVLFVLISSVVAIIYSTNVNSLGILPAAFQKSVLFGFSFLLVVQFQLTLEILFALPLIMLAFRKIFKVGMLPDPRHLLFDVGVIAGILSLFYVEAIVLISFCWMASLIFRSFNVKTIIIPVIGLFAAYTIAFFLSFVWSEFDFFEIIKNQYIQIQWDFTEFDFQLILNLSGLLLLGLISLVNVLKSIVKATVFKRQVMSLCLGLILLTLVFTLSQKSAGHLLVFMIFPLGIVLYDLLLSLKKWWQKDLIYLILILNLVLVFL